MKRPSRNPVTLAWLFLLIATVLSSALAETHRGVSWAALLVVLIAVVKIDVIMRHFMEVKGAPLIWRVLMRAWALGAGCIAAFMVWRSSGWGVP